MLFFTRADAFFRHRCTVQNTRHSLQNFQLQKLKKSIAKNIPQFWRAQHFKRKLNNIEISFEKITYLNELFFQMIFWELLARLVKNLDCENLKKTLFCFLIQSSLVYHRVLKFRLIPGPHLKRTLTMILSKRYFDVDAGRVFETPDL